MAIGAAVKVTLDSVLMGDDVQYSLETIETNPMYQINDATPQPL
jgi:hypothetical protein